MSAVTKSAPGTAPGTTPSLAAPSLLRLTGVELRKATDTRASRWLLIAVLLSSLAVIVAQLLTGDAADRTFGDFYGGAQLGASILLPVVGILAVTGEWSQRTALATFALSPRRGRVVAAKFGAGLVLVISVVLAATALAAGANLLAPILTDAAGTWAFDAEGLGRGVLYQLSGYLVGAGFGLLLLNTPLAIVGYFVLPTLWSILGGTVASLEQAAAWLDLSSTTPPLLDGVLDGEAWAQAGTSMAVWFVLPVVLGTVRVLRSEIK